MKHLCTLLVLTFCLSITCLAQRPKSSVPLADPYILLDGDTYYSYGTHADDGIAYYTSNDLQVWSSQGLALHKSNTTEDQRFWAPEVYKMGNRYIMYYSANEHLFAATADSPRGPFKQVGGYMLQTLIGDEKCIDSSVFIDDDGRIYLFFVRFTDGNCIWMCELQSDGITPVEGSLRHCISVSAAWEQKMARVCEGPFVIKRNNIYYLTYSANHYQSPDYGVGYAQTRSLTGTWKKYSGNPILQRRDNLIGTGHHSLFTDKEGQLRIVFHAHDTETNIHPRRMYIGTVAFNNNAMRITDDTVIRPCSDQLYLKGNIAPSNTLLTYMGNGRFEKDVKLNDSGVFLFPDKNIYFAYDNNEELAFFKDVHINGGTYHFTVDVNEGTWKVDAPIDEFKISAFGSSVCNGQGADNFRGYAYLYGQQLKKRYDNQLSDHPFHVSGIAIGGNTTQSLLNRFDDMTRDFSRYVIIGLSLGNEGIHEATDKQATMKQFATNMQTLISRIRQQGKVPVVMNNYTRGDFTLDDYAAIKQVNLQIHQWDVASVNTLGAIDNGAGQWAAGYIQDNGHPNTAGHREFLYAIPPSLFDALASGKAQPVRNLSQSMMLSQKASIRFTGEETVHPFTVSLRFKGRDAGQLFSYNTTASRVGSVSVDDEGHIIYSANGKALIQGQESVLDDNWHTVTLTHYYALGRSFLYVDGQGQGYARERINAAAGFIVGDTTSTARRQVSELFFWRAALSPEEVQAVSDGKMLKSSLELYVPLASPTSLENKAMSLNQVQYVSGSTTDLQSLRVEETSPCNTPLYNLLGQRINHPAHGLFVNHQRKIMLR